MARKAYVRDDAPLSRFGVLVAQLESIVASAAQQSPDPLLCFDLLSDLISAISEEPKESVLLWQRKCEDALYSLLVLGARRPVRHLASVAMARIIMKGDPISIYSRASSLQGFLSDGKKSEPHRVTGAAQCLGELYRFFGRKITSGLPETTSIASKLMRSHEDYVRKEALNMLQNALEGSGGTALSAAYSEAFRLIMRSGVSDKSFIVKKAAARCLKAFADIGGPGLGITEFDSSASSCVKALDDPISSVRDAFAEALGALLALGMNPEAQVQPRGKGQSGPAKKLDGGLQRHLISPFVKASGSRSKTLRIGLTLSWVSFLQAIRLKYLHPDSELQDFTSQVMEMLRLDTNIDAQALACVLYILRVGLTDQMTEPTQRSFLAVLGKQLQSPDNSPAMKVAALRTLSYTLKTLGEVPAEFKDVLDDTVVAALSHSSQLVRVEAALTLRALAEVDPTCVGGLVSYGVTMLAALRENVSFEKGSNLKEALDSLHGQATVLASLVSVSPKLPLGYPAGLPKSVLDVSKKMLTETSRNPGAATVEREAGWLLLSSLLASMPKEELEDQVFDILTLWMPLFSGSLEHEFQQTGDLTSKLCIWASAVDALTAFIRCFITPCSINDGILLQPVLVYLNSVLSCLASVTTKEPSNAKPAMNVLIIRTLIAFQSLSDPMAYRRDHEQILQICTAPFKNASAFEESSCLRSLLDKRDAWLGPWVPGRAWFEDELRAFQGGKDGLVPCVWDPEIPSFPQPETVGKTLVNQMLLCFGVMFAFQDSTGMMSLLGMVEQCLKIGRKQSWHAASVTNICVGLLSGLKALLALRPQTLASDILSSLQAIFQGILAEGDICASQRRASSECLGLLTRLGSDAFTARMTKSLLSDLTVSIDSNYAGSVALALGCIHRSAGGMALSSMVPATVSSVSLLAKSSVAGLQIWSLHGLLLTIEAAGLSYVSHVQATLSLALEVLLAEENGWVDLQQGVGRLINAIVAVLGPELAPGSIFFSRCKSVISEVSSCQETATLLESVRFTQQLALFAPQALSVHSHVQTLLPTLSSRQPALRHLAISTLRHLVEKDPNSVIHEKIEDNLFHMLDEETDAEIGNLVRNTIMRLLYASCPSHPSHWISVCRKMVLAASTGNSESEAGFDQDPTNSMNEGLGDDGDNMVSSSEVMPQLDFNLNSSSAKREKHLRYRTRVFAAECLSHLPTAVGRNPAHFDLSLARKPIKNQTSADWLVLQLQELVSLAYQISTIQFENMQPVGVGLLYAIIDKFETAPDPELPGHLLLEQYQAQLVSALRSALGPNSGPILLEAGLQLATKILTSGIIHGDQAATKRIFSLISRPLDDFKELYYPSFAEWVSCKIKIRLLAAHASLKCYTYSFLRRHCNDGPHESLALLPLFSKSSSVLGRHWINLLKDYCFTCFHMDSWKNWKPFLDGIQSPMVSSKLRTCLEETWPIILQAVVLDAVPVKDSTLDSADGMLKKELISGYSMVELEPEEFHFLWGLALLVLFQGKNSTIDKQIVTQALAKAKFQDSLFEETKSPNLKLYEVVLPVFQCLCTASFFNAGFSTVDLCNELLQVFTFVGCKGGSWNSLAVAVLAQIVQNCPDAFLNGENFAHLAMELCLAYLFETLQRLNATSPNESSKDDFISLLLGTVKTLVNRFEPKMQLKSILLLILTGYNFIRGTSSETIFSTINEFVLSAGSLLKTFIDDQSHDKEVISKLQMIIGACQNAIHNMLMDCLEGIHLLENRQSSLRRLVHTMLAFCLEQTLSFASLVYKLEQLQGSEHTHSINMVIFKDCIKSFDIVLSDSNIQVQAIGLQVLKNTLQKKATTKGDSFMVVLIGELFRDVLMVIHNTLKEPVTRESAALAGECLRILMLMHTLPRVDDCRKGLMNVFLECIVMVVLRTEDGRSQEDMSDLRSTAIRLVSNVAQIPSAALHLKDVLLGMPAAHRQQIQGIIRSSVSQEQSTHLEKSSGQTLGIKLHLQSEGTKVETNESNENVDDEDDDWNGDDDWDAFQSFPASTSATNQESKPESSPEENLTAGHFNISESNMPEKSMPSDLQDAEEANNDYSVESSNSCLHKGDDEAVPCQEPEPAPLKSLLVNGKGLGEEENHVNQESQIGSSVCQLSPDSSFEENPKLENLLLKAVDMRHDESFEPAGDSELEVSVDRKNTGQHLQNAENPDSSESSVSSNKNVVINEHVETDVEYGKEISLEEQTQAPDQEMSDSSGLLSHDTNHREPIVTAEIPVGRTSIECENDEQNREVNNSSMPIQTPW